MSARATSPVLGVVLLLVVTAVLAGTVGSFAFAGSLPGDPPRAVVDLRIDQGDERLAFVHRGGDALDVAALTIRVRIDGTPLDHQPPVPFFSATGFRPGPTGPFNTATDERWTAGERASVRLAGTNDPELAPGAEVTVTLSVDGQVVVRLEGTA